MPSLGAAPADAPESATQLRGLWSLPGLLMAREPRQADGLLDLSFLTEEEQEAIAEVLKRMPACASWRTDQVRQNREPWRKGLRPWGLRRPPPSPSRCTSLLDILVDLALPLVPLALGPLSSSPPSGCQLPC